MIERGLDIENLLRADCIVCVSGTLLRLVLEQQTFSEKHYGKIVYDERKVHLFSLTDAVHHERSEYGHAHTVNK